MIKFLFFYIYEELEMFYVYFFTFLSRWGLLLQSLFKNNFSSVFRICFLKTELEIFI